MAMPALNASFVEWRGPDFQQFQPLEIWLLGLLALGLTTGIKLPWPRVLLLAGLCHMALAHARHADLLGLVGPLSVAGSLGPQLTARICTGAPSAAGRVAARLAEPAGPPAILLALAAMVLLSLPLAVHPLRRTDDLATPAAALAAARQLGLSGRVFNSEQFGGYLVFRGVPSFIDGRIEMYGNAFLACYLDAANGDANHLQALLDQWGVRWALLAKGQPATQSLDHMTGWRRVYADARAVVYTRDADRRESAELR
jgi:hypothetical protein